MNSIKWDDFERVDLRVGTIVKATGFPEARKPAYKVWIDFGKEIGVKKSSAQITHHYTTEDLLGKQVICVINFPEKQIGPFLSQVLITGFADENNNIVLATVDGLVGNGARLI